MTIYYSATTNAFYDSQVYNVNNIPEDKVAVAESTYKNLMAQQCAGRVIVAAADGTPTTIAQTCGPCTSTKYATKTELTNGLAAKANDSNVVHKTGDEHINGVKSFGSVIKATNGTVQVGADTGYSVTFNYNGNITSKQARGTYNIFFPEGSGTLALTSDIKGKANDSDVVHKTGNETIEGIKTFTNGTQVTSNLTTAGYSIKNTAIVRNEVPTQLYHATFRAYDKNNKILGEYCVEKSTTGCTLLNMSVRSEDSNGEQLSESLYLDMSNDGNTVRFYPSSNNKMDLGMSNHKWAKVYSDDVVHTSGDENISGNKVFRDPISRKSDITTIFGDIVYRFEDSNNSPCGYIQNSAHYWQNNLHNRHLAHNNTSGKEIYLDIISRNNGTGVVNISGDVTNIDNVTTVTSSTDYSSIATMGWVNNPATSTNVVHRSGDETIAGNKTFSNKIKGNLQGNADSSTKASYLDNYSLPGINRIYLDWDVQVKGYVGLKVDQVDIGGLITTKNIGSQSVSSATKATQDASGNVITTTYAINANPANRQLLCSFEGGLDEGHITLSAPYTNYKALLVVFSHDNGDRMASEKVDTYELALRQEIAKENAAHGDQSFCLIGNPEGGWWSCSGSSTTTVLYHVDNKDIRIHKIYGLA